MRIYEFELPRDLSEFERRVLHERLLSFGKPYSFVVENGVLRIEFAEPLSPYEERMLPRLVDIWAKPHAELNFDIDQDGERLSKLLGELIARFGAENVYVRRSARGMEDGERYHIKVEGQFSPSEVLRIREELGDDPPRLEMDKIKHQHGLEVGFLYDEKYGVWAGEWVPAKKLLKQEEQR